MVVVVVLGGGGGFKAGVCVRGLGMASPGMCGPHQVVGSPDSLHEVGDTLGAPHHLVLVLVYLRIYVGGSCCV